MKDPLSLLLALLLCACSEPPQSSTPDLGLDTGGRDLALPDTGVHDTKAPLRTGVVLRGLGFDWQKTPHRLNKLGAMVQGKPQGQAIELELSSLMEGGSWSTGQAASDKVEYEVGYTAVRTRAARFVEGTFAPIQVKGDAKAKPEVVAQASQKQQLSLTAVGLSGAKQVVLVLRGFTIDTDLTHEDGYTNRGFTVRLQNTERQGDQLLTTLLVRVHAGPVVDRDQNLESYGATVTVGYTLIALDSGQVATKTVGYELDLPGGVEPKQPPADATKALQSFGGLSSISTALVALSGFEIYLNRGDTLFPGRYLRAVRVMNEKLSLDPGKGEASLWTDGYYSNAGLVTNPTKLEFTADLALIGLDDPDARVEDGSATGTAGVGLVTDTTTVTFE